MGDFNMHTVKRRAHREAWYGASTNPFRRGPTRSRDCALDNVSNAMHESESIESLNSVKSESQQTIKGGLQFVAVPRPTTSNNEAEVEHNLNKSRASTETSDSGNSISQDVLSADPRTQEDFQRQDNPFSFTPGTLNKLINPKSISAFYALGGLAGLEKGLRTDRHSGLSSDETLRDKKSSLESQQLLKCTVSSDDIPTDEIVKLRHCKWFNQRVREEEALVSQRKSSKKSSRHKHFTLTNQINATLFNSRININMLLIGIPLGVALHMLKGPALFILALNFLGFIPLAALFSYALEELAFRVGEVVGGVFNVTFGNVIECIFSSGLFLSRPIEALGLKRQSKACIHSKRPHRTTSTSFPQVLLVFVTGMSCFTPIVAAVIPLPQISTDGFTTSLIASTATSEAVATTTSCADIFKPTTVDGFNRIFSETFLMKTFHLVVFLYEAGLATTITCIALWASANFCQNKESRILSLAIMGAFQGLLFYLREEDDASIGLLIGLFASGAIFTYNSMNPGVSDLGFGTTYVTFGLVSSIALQAVLYPYTQYAFDIVGSKQIVLFLPFTTTVFGLMEAATQTIDNVMGSKKNQGQGLPLHNNNSVASSAAPNTRRSAWPNLSPYDNQGVLTSGFEDTPLNPRFPPSLTHPR